MVNAYCITVPPCPIVISFGGTAFPPKNIYLGSGVPPRLRHCRDVETARHRLTGVKIGHIYVMLGSGSTEAMSVLDDSFRPNMEV